MRVEADNKNYEYFDVSIELSENETELATGLDSFCFGVSRIIMEMLDMCSNNKDAITKLSEIILDNISKNVNNYVEKYDEIKLQEKINEAYDMMNEMYLDWLDDVACITEEEFLDEFDGSDELKYVLKRCEDGIDVYISNGIDEETLTHIEKDDVDNDEKLNNICMITHAIAVIVGDKVIGEDSNPFRNGENEKVLFERIRSFCE